MSNTFLTPEWISKTLVAHLYNDTILASLVHRDFDPDFQGTQGETITVRTPATFTAREFDPNTGVQPQAITEGMTTVTLDKFPDVSVEIGSKEMTLDLDRVEERVIVPMKEALVQYVDGLIAECLVDTAKGAGGGGTADGTTFPNEAFRTARARLGRANLPNSDRYYVLSPEANSDALGDDLLVKANESGSTDGLREAQIGRVYGFDGYESSVFGYGPGDKGQADGVAFHKSAVCLVTRVPAPPIGGVQHATANYKGLGLRVVMDYNSQFKKNLISIDLLAGVQKVSGREKGAVVLNFGQGS